MEPEHREIYSKRLLFGSVILLGAGLIVLTIGLIGFQTFLTGEAYENYQFCKEIISEVYEGEIDPSLDPFESLESLSGYLECVDRFRSLEVVNGGFIFGGMGLIVISALFMTIRYVMKRKEQAS